MSKFRWFIWSLIIIISFSYSFTGNNNKLQSSQMITISPKKFKEFNSKNGVIAVLTIRSLKILLKETRSQKVVYEVQVENNIVGDMDKFDSIWSYGLPKLEEGKKYLIFLDRGKRFSGDGDFQNLFCEQCDDIVIACKNKLNKHQE